MTAFNEGWVSSSFDYLRRVAQYYNCNPCFDGVKNINEKVAKMNEKGEYGYLACLCKVNTKCPCVELENDLEETGKCYCGIFVRRV